jgi:hypothetical protein
MQLTTGVRQPAAWYAGFAGYAACVALFSGPGLDRWWGVWAAGGYALAAVIAAIGPARGRQVIALAVAVAGALIAPLTWLATRAPLTPDAAVVMRSGTLLLRHGTPYLPAAQLAHGGWLAYDPYLPVMALFGVPKALGLPGILGDERPWLAAATFVLLLFAFRIAARRGALRRFAGTRPVPGRPVPGRPVPGQAATAPSALALAAFAIASPVMAFPLAMGITDPPMIAVICLALALLIRRRHAAAMTVRGVVPAALVLSAGCAMKYTAWPALPVIAVMIAKRDGKRAAVAFTAATIGAAVVSFVALAPGALGDLKAVALNTIAYPLGLTAARSPAQSPLPGHLLTSLGGSAGHLAAIALLAAAGVALAASLVTAPPLTPAATAARIALGLTALFALCPATRYGYFVYPLALFGWAALTARPAIPRYAGSAAPFRTVPWTIAPDDTAAGRLETSSRR